MNCIFITIFNQEKYIDIFFLLLESILIYGNLNSNTNILVYTSTLFANIIKDNELYNNKIIFEINDAYDSIDKACKAKLDVFNLKSIVNYNKILYLDTYILIKGNINIIFDLCIDDILYVLEEGKIDNITDYWGKSLFNNDFNNYIDKTAFTCNIILFKNSKIIKFLFDEINKDIINRPQFLKYYDQPYIIFNAFKYSMYNNKLLKKFLINNDINIHSDQIIHHFPDYPGIYKDKIQKMTIFLDSINQYTFKNKNKIFDVMIPPIKNNILSLVGICVSYDYFDTLKFMLPVNYLHFEKIYLITQEDDIKTINFCKEFNNVNILFYDFKNNNCKFDKFGAINYARKIVYEKYPDSWYLIIDSDIILPNNFINILINENLNSNCIYGAIRINVLKSSELLNKKEIINSDKNINFLFNNILYKKYKPPSILGCFQLYKKKCFNKNKYISAVVGDYHFGYENFNLFCNLENLVYLHLGEGNANKNGLIKKVSFIDNISISLNNIYFNFHKSCNNSYYDNNCKLVKYGNNKNIGDNIYTYSDKMLKDIANFFKNNSYFKIIEIGSNKGNKIKILSNIFSKVYSVDNNIEFNEKSKNIEYIYLDIDKDSWEILPNDIEVSFIATRHNYKNYKNYIYNSIKIFKKLKYIIIDNYSISSDVKKAIDEMIKNKILVFEKFIGKNNVPNPEEIVYGINECIICSINKSNITNRSTIINKKYFTNIIKLRSIIRK